MELTVTEAATLLGRSPRAVRRQLARGELPGRKRDGRWVVERGDLPLTAEAHAALHDKVATLRDAVEAGIPRAVRDRLALGGLEQLDVFRICRDVLAEMRCSDGSPNPSMTSDDSHVADGTRQDGDAIACARVALGEATLDLAEGHHQYDPEDKRAVLNRARRGLSHAIATLLLAQPAPGTALRRWATRLEADALPRLAGLIRWTERLSPASRPAARAG